VAEAAPIHVYTVVRDGAGWWAVRDGSARAYLARLGRRDVVVEIVGEEAEVRVHPSLRGYLRRLRREGGDGPDRVLAAWPPPFRDGVFALDWPP